MPLQSFYEKHSVNTRVICALIGTIGFLGCAIAPYFPELSWQIAIITGLLLIGLSSISLSWIAGRKDKVLDTALVDINNRLFPIWSKQICEARDLGNQSIEGIISSFSRLQTCIGVLLAHSINHKDTVEHDLKDLTEQLLVDLQFQDRISQMLKPIEEDMKHLSETIQQGLQRNEFNYDVQEWLQSLRTRYVMEEQRAHHDGKKPNRSTLGVDFFE